MFLLVCLSWLWIIIDPIILISVGTTFIFVYMCILPIRFFILRCSSSSVFNQQFLDITGAFVLDWGRNKKFAVASSTTWAQGVKALICDCCRYLHQFDGWRVVAMVFLLHHRLELYRSDQIIEQVFPFDLMKILTFFNRPSVEVVIGESLRINASSSANG